MNTVGRALAIGLSLLWLAQPSAEARPTPSVARTTIISASGNTVTELRIAPGTRLDPSAVKVDLVGGTYFFARAVAQRPNAGCPAYVGRYCEAWHVDWLRGLSDTTYGGQPFVAVSDPPTWSEDRLRLWILTDGKAKLTLRFPALSGTASLTSQRPAQGAVVTLGSCDTCLPNSAGGYSAEGVTLRLPKKSTVWAEVYSVATDANGRVSTNALRASEICIYPRGGADANASPDASDHPAGCDDSGTDTSAAMRSLDSAVHLASSAQITSSATEWTFWSEARDSVYLGRRALDVALSEQNGARSRTYGIWFVHDR